MSKNFTRHSIYLILICLLFFKTSNLFAQCPITNYAGSQTFAMTPGTNGINQFGQSFKATCSGHLLSITINCSAPSVGSSFSGTLTVSASGARLTPFTNFIYNQPFTATVGSGGVTTVTLSSPPALSQDSTYLFFFTPSSNVTVLESCPGSYADGGVYYAQTAFPGGYGANYCDLYFGVNIGTPPPPVTACSISNLVGSQTFAMTPGTNGINQFGQSFKATCTGHLLSIKINCSAPSVGSSLSGTLTVSSSGARLTPFTNYIYNQPFTATVGSGGVTTVTLSSPPALSQDSTYLFFFTPSSNVTVLESCPGSYADGEVYYAQTAFPGGYGANYCDLNFAVNIGIPPCTANSATVTVSACGSYKWHGTTYTTSTNTATFDSLNVGGCDSLTTLHLTINHPATSTTTLAQCGNGYTWNGVNYNSPGTYTKTFTGGAANGCDSIATLNLTFKTVPKPVIFQTACDSFYWNGTMYYASGAYNNFGTAANGCDSVTTLILTINNSSSSITNASLCPSALPYHWNGNDFFSTGSYTVHLTNTVNCDSAATLNLNVIQVISTYAYDTICSSQLPFTWHGLTFSAAGSRPLFLTSAAGCDSIVTLVLTVKQATTSTTTFTSCGSYTWNGQTYTNSGTYTKTFTGGNAKGCDSTATLVLTVSAANTWIGATSTNWNTGSNWACGTVPVSGADVTITNGANYPVLTGAISVGAINIATGASVSLNGNTLNISGAVSGTGVIKSGTGSTLAYTSATNSTVYFGTGTDSLLTNLTVSGAGTLTLGSGIGITNLLSITSGGLNTGNHLTLKSTSIANTAVVGPVSGSVTGNVTIERFILQGVKSYRSLITGGLYNAGSIFKNWQESGVTNNGYGIFITGKAGTTNGVDATTGFDISGAGNKSMYNYFTYMTYSTVNNTKTTNLDPYTAYLTVVYGNRSLPLIPSSVFDASANMHSAATIRTTGSLVTGTVTYSNTGVTGNYSSAVTKILPLKDTGSFIANPYACVIDWESLSRTNLTTSYYYYEPTYMNGGYQSFVFYNGTSHTNSNPTKSKINRYLQPGQGFWIQTNSTVTTNRQLVITEANKVTNQPFTAVFGTGAAGINRLAMSLWKEGNNIDGTVAVFDNNFTSAYGDEDSKKIFSTGENIAIAENNQSLSIDGLANPAVNDVIALQTTGMTVGKTYTIQLDAQELNTNGLNAYLLDATLQTEQLLTAASNTYSFTAYKVNDNRFSVVFKAGNALPVKFIIVKANQGTDKKTNVISWTVANEVNIDHYEVEQSATGKDYAKITVNNASNSNSYTATDNNLHSAVNYYRIKAVDKDSKYAYSQVVKVSATEKASVVVAPNPVIGDKVTVQMNNLEAGKYTMSLYNNAGQLVANKEVTHTTGNTTIELPINGTVANGVYSLRVIGVNNYTTEVIISRRQ